MNFYESFPARLWEKILLFGNLKKLRLLSSGLMHDLPAAHGHAHFRVANRCGIDFFQIVREEDEIGVSARLKRSPVMISRATQGGMGGVGLQRVTRGDPLVRAEEDTAAAHAVYRGMHAAKGSDRQHGRIHVQPEGHAKPHGGAGGIRRSR